MVNAFLFSSSLNVLKNNTSSVLISLSFHYSFSLLPCFHAFPSATSFHSLWLLSVVLLLLSQKSLSLSFFVQLLALVIVHPKLVLTSGKVGKKSQHDERISVLGLSLCLESLMVSDPLLVFTPSIVRNISLLMRHSLLIRWFAVYIFVCVLLFLQCCFILSWVDWRSSLR